MFVEIARRYKTLVVADEVHHADDALSFGDALSDVASQATYRLALSGTPFNSSGGALAMCESEEFITDEGRLVRRALPLHTYSYGDAIRDNSCRQVEFVKVTGKGYSTYRSLADDKLFQKLVDLSKENKSDSLGPMLDPGGEFMQSMVKDALASLTDLRKHDKRAAMLVVAKDKEHGSRLCALIEDYCRDNENWRGYSICELYNDTPKAHDRIKQLDKDGTDIVVAVRLLSEGVDVKRLRVGLYATDYLTRMFFIQFIGRFIRWEDRLDATQHARVIIPGHVELLRFAREIEVMVEDALISGEGEGNPGKTPEPKNEFVSSESEKTGDGLILRGEEEEDRTSAEAFLNMYPSLRGVIPESVAAKAARDAHIDGHQSADIRKPKENWRAKNISLVQMVVRVMKANGETDDFLFAKVQAQANAAAGISRVDGLTTDEELITRYNYLLGRLRSIRKGEVDE